MNGRGRRRDGEAKMNSHKDQVRNLIARAASMCDQARQEVRSAGGPALPILGDVAVRTVIPRGLKGASRQLGRSALRAHKEQVNERWRSAGAALAHECETAVSRMSIRTGNLTPEGNSQRLVRKFNYLRRIKTATTFLENLIGVLQEIEGLDLVWNHDIGGELEGRRQLREAMRPRAREGTRRFEGARVRIVERLKGFPRASQSIASAFDRMGDADPEAPRHVIVSCRVAIEQLCLEATSEKDWKKGLVVIIASESERRHVKQNWDYLSKAAHGGHTPDAKEAEHCLDLTVGLLEFILERKR